MLYHDLVKRRAAQIGALLHQADARKHVNGRADPTDAKARREDLRDGAQVDDAVVLRLQRNHMPALVAQTAVGVVLDDQEVVLVRKLNQALAALARHGDAAGILEIGNGIEHLQAFVALADAPEFLFQQIHAHALVVEGHGMNFGLVGVECGKRRQVGGTFHQNDVALVEECLAEQVQRLLRARSKQHLVGLHAHADVAHDVAKHLAGFEAAVGRAVLQGDSTLVGDGGVHRLLDGALRKERHVGHATGKRDDVRANRRGEEVAHGARAQIPHAVGDFVARLVEFHVCCSHGA